ncbi:MAG: DNA repair protein RadA, partial [Pseudomonadota bacterium]
MAKAKIAYVCSECGAHSVKWAGQCPDCNAWNTLTETSVGSSTVPGDAPKATTLADLPDDVDHRYATGFAELDRVLGGGLVPGAVILLGGDPGVGKSTLLQQASSNLMQDLAVCYATGEESLRQIGQRSLRLGVDAKSMNLLSDTSLENVLAEATRCGANVLVIDSIQTMTSDAIPSAPGSVAQLRESVGRLVQFAKRNEVSVFIIGHVTKEGAIAGPRVVEHMVDTVLYFEGDRGRPFRILRTVKNRFGATDEIGDLTFFCDVPHKE